MFSILNLKMSIK